MKEILLTPAVRCLLLIQHIILEITRESVHKGSHYEDSKQADYNLQQFRAGKSDDFVCIESFDVGAPEVLAKAFRSDVIANKVKRAGEPVQIADVRRNEQLNLQLGLLPVEVG